MIDIPLGKALVPEEVKTIAGMMGCNDCCLITNLQRLCRDSNNKRIISCTDEDRLDKKNVIYKLVDYPVAYLFADAMLTEREKTNDKDSD